MSVETSTANLTKKLFTVLVLAGRRGPTDPVARAAGCSHKVLVPVAGIPMLVRVLRAVRAVSQVKHIAVSIDDPAILDSLPEVRSLVESGAVQVHPSGPSPAASVLTYFQSLSPQESLVVTTADHPLLTAEMFSYFCTAVTKSDADVGAGVMAASVFRKQYPHSKRSFIPLRDESFCGTNLFALCTPRAASAARFWGHAGQFRKRPWRLISTFGVTNLLLLALRRLDLQGAIPRASRALGARVAVVQMPFPECAIDVDNLDDFAVATKILTARENQR
jgi:molybdopterin-guanine dinucleotide biosynthesis protein A